MLPVVDGALNQDQNPNERQGRKFQMRIGHTHCVWVWPTTKTTCIRGVEFRLSFMAMFLFLGDRKAQKMLDVSNLFFC